MESEVMKRFECKKQDTEVNWKPMETRVSVCSSWYHMTDNVVLASLSGTRRRRAI